MNEGTRDDARCASDLPVRRTRRGTALAIAAIVAVGIVGMLARTGSQRESESEQVRGAAVFPFALLSGALNQDLGPGEYIFLPVRHAVWVVNRTEGRFARYEFENDRKPLVQRSRVVTLDPRTFPPDATEYLVSDRNLTDDLWVCQRRSGLVVLYETRLAGDLVARESGHDLGPGSYEFYPTRYTMWVVDKTRGTMEYLQFRKDFDQTVVRSERVLYRLVDFPPRDLEIRLSERNYAEVLWLCNRRSGDIQIWQPSPAGNGIRLVGTFVGSL
ncbi:MAG TPA: hypothetical protein VK116_05200 [Planctomycetota bacterium]|nr:hypothetical protein [Planctomycetota bacterium]